MKKNISALLLVLMLCICMALPCFAAQEQIPCVRDLAQLLSKDEANALEKDLEQIADTFHVQVAVVTVENCEEMDRADYTKEIYKECGYGLGENKDGILLLIDMDPDDRGWHIYGKGLGADAMTASEIEAVGEAITPDLKDGDYADAFDTFAQRCEERIDIAINGEPYDAVKSLIISVVIGVVLALIVTGSMKSKLKSVKAQRAAANYVRQGSMNVTESYELFLYRTVDRKEKPKSSSSDSSASKESSGGGSF